MKYYLVLIEYKTALENIIRITEEHRKHLKKAYDTGMFLISGPRIPRTGGIVIAKVPSENELEKFFSEDPYKLHGYADYKFIEFDPKSWMSELGTWIEKKP